MIVIDVLKRIMFAVFVYIAVQFLLIAMLFFILVEGENFFARFEPKDNVK